MVPDRNNWHSYRNLYNSRKNVSTLFWWILLVLRNEMRKIHFSLKSEAHLFTFTASKRFEKIHQDIYWALIHRKKKVSTINIYHICSYINISACMYSFCKHQIPRETSSAHKTVKILVTVVYIGFRVNK